MLEGRQGGVQFLLAFPASFLEVCSTFQFAVKSDTQISGLAAVDYGAVNFNSGLGAGIQSNDFRLVFV